MAHKVILDDLVSLTNETTATNKINLNSRRLEVALENTLSRDGSEPNAMQADFDMNSHRLMNLPAPQGLTEPVRVSDLDEDFTVTFDPHADQTPFTPAGNIAATDVQAAIEELDAEKQPLDADLTAIAALTTAAYGRGLLETTSEANFKAATNLEASTDYYAPGGTDVPVADGGSGRSTATEYAVICGGTTTTGAHQSIASVGTSGQVLTSNGAAALPTFQTHTTGVVLLTSGTVTSAATLDIVLTSFTAYRLIKIFLSSFLPATDGDDLWLRVSTDGGSNYDATGYSYAGTRDRDGSSSGVVQSAAANQIVITDPTGGLDTSNSATEGGVDAEITLQDQTNTARYPAVRYWTRYMSATGPETINVAGSGTRENAQDTDAVRFLFSTGDIASGKYAVYGYN